MTVKSGTALVTEEGTGPNDVVQRRLGPGFWIPIGWITLMVGVALLAPILPIADPEETGVGGRLDPPSWDNWFGTDTNGRDMFARTIWGARVSLVVGFVALVVGFVIGGTIGVIAGFFRGLVDRLSMSVVFVLLSFPGLALALMIIGLLGQSLGVVSIVLSLAVVAPVARLARATTLSFAERDFVSAARVLGATDRRIMAREILPNVLIPLSALSLLGLGLTIVGEGGLAYLGLSVENGFSWGKMIQLGAAPRTLRTGPWVAFTPIGAMFLTVLSLNFAGDRLRDYFDVREVGISGR
ncbi:MAG: ABC transporter permease [Acidimicrobiales bacterium]|nr:ABC transporter permease [Acidimicrobiales bacterium]